MHNSLKHFVLALILLSIQCAAQADPSKLPSAGKTGVKRTKVVTTQPVEKKSLAGARAEKQPSKVATNAQTLANSASSKSGTLPQKHYLRQLEFEVLGSSCYACIRKIEMDLRALQGVEIAKANMKQPPVVTVIYDMDKVSADALVKNVQNGGYTVRNQQDAFFKITGSEPAKSKFVLYDLPGLRP